MSFIAFLLLSIISRSEEVANWKKGNKDRESIFYWKKINKILLIITLPFFLLLPSKESVTRMYVIPKIMNNDVIQQIPDDAKEIYELGIKNLKKELKIEKEKENE